MAKRPVKKKEKNCTSCAYGIETNPDPLIMTPRTRCRRFPTHTIFNSDHWCGEHKEKT